MADGGDTGYFIVTSINWMIELYPNLTWKYWNQQHRAGSISVYKLTLMSDNFTGCHIRINIKTLLQGLRRSHYASCPSFAYSVYSMDLCVCRSGKDRYLV
jgi:hypothetical protein